MTLFQKKILIIDDSEIDHYLIAHLLTPSGAVIYPAYTGVDGIEVAKAIIPDLIILDKVLPDLSPFVFLKRVREIERLQLVPIILYTAQLLNDDWPLLQQAGVADLLIKHISADQLIIRLTGYL